MHSSSCNICKDGLASTNIEVISCYNVNKISPYPFLRLISSLNNALDIEMNFCGNMNLR
jgi:hypothetical protein